MEENENEVVMEDLGGNGNSVMKKVIIGVIALVAIILVIVGIVNAVKPTPEKKVKELVKNLNGKKASKIIDEFDMVGVAAFAYCDGDYEDFADNYEEYKDEMDDDDLEDAIEEYKDAYEELFDDIDTLKVEIKKIKSAKKVKEAKNLYKVNAKIKVEYKEDEDDKTERDTSTYDFYVYKKSGKYYLVGSVLKDGDGLLQELGFIPEN